VWCLEGNTSLCQSDFQERQQAAVSRQRAGQACGKPGLYSHRQECSHHRGTKGLALSAVNLSAAITSCAKKRILIYTGFARSNCGWGLNF